MKLNVVEKMGADQTGEQTFCKIVKIKKLFKFDQVKN